jgi:hypothetical protein
VFSRFTGGVLTGGVLAAFFGIISFSDTVEITYQTLLAIIATAQPVTTGTGFQGSIGETGIERGVTVLATARKLT